jgi:protein-S-isoprenylcysteine O-methyltransferase Ste14
MDGSGAAGMGDLLDCLGVSGPWSRPVTSGSIWVGFGTAMVGVAAAQALVEWAVGASTTTVASEVAAVWAAWTVWHSYVFEQHRQRYLASDLQFPYRRAFMTDIFPGITIGFSQMLRPAWNGINLHEGLFPRVAGTPAGVAEQAAGLLVFAAAFALFTGAWRTLGAARVGFASEFVGASDFTPLRRGPYGQVRHPLFWAGVGVSWSLALLTRTKTSAVVALINTGYGLLYNSLEDRRLRTVFGERYGRYSREVPRIVPVGLFSGRRRRAAC